MFSVKVLSEIEIIGEITIQERKILCTLTTVSFVFLHLKSRSHERTFIPANIMNKRATKKQYASLKILQ